MGVISVYSAECIKHKNVTFAKFSFNVKPGGVYSYKCVAKN